MNLLHMIIEELMEERERHRHPWKNFGLSNLETDLNREPIRSRMARREPLSGGYYHRPWRTGSQISSGVSDVTLSNSRFKVNLDVQQFHPEEIAVKVIDNNLVIEGSHPERADDYGFISRSFVRRYLLPENVDLSTVQSSLSSDGVLHVTAEPKAVPTLGERIIPIIHQNHPAPQNQGDNSTI